MNKVRHICNNFLISLDEYLRDNLDSLTCADICNIYFDFFRDLKDYKGNSNGFTGLSEYIIFRFIYHLLGGSFERKSIKNTSLYEFVSKDNIYRINQNTPFKVGLKKKYPDIIIYKSDVPILVIEIKIYLTYGIKTLREDLDKLNEINKEYPGSKSLFICYNKINEGKIYDSLLNGMKVNDRLNFITLCDNSESFKDELQKLVK